MQKTLILVIIAGNLTIMGAHAISANFTNTCNESTKTVACLKPSKLVYAEYAGFSAVSLDVLVSAIAEVESGNNARAMGDQNRAAGCLQIYRCALLDVNSRFGTTYSWPSDCLNPITARQIAKLYLIICGLGKMSLEKTVRNYNGGSKGYKKKSTEHYWLKVKKILTTTEYNSANRIKN